MLAGERRLGGRGNVSDVFVRTWLRLYRQMEGSVGQDSLETVIPRLGLMIDHAPVLRCSTNVSLSHLQHYACATTPFLPSLPYI